MKDLKKYKNIISGIIIIITIILAIMSCRNINVDPYDTKALGAALKAASMLPTFLAIFLAFMYKNVIISLASGLLLGGLMMNYLYGNNFFNFFKISLDALVETTSDYGNASIILLCFGVGGLIEIIRNTGSFESLANKLTKRIDTPRKANLIGQLLGIVVFFDDYANSLIVGPIMKPIFDKLKISREKLAYIVDSTAAPVTGIALISSWVAVEVGVIEEGLANANITNLSGYGLFLSSIPFCFYCIFCLLFIFISSLTKREFGPMLEAEKLARKGIINKEEDDELIIKNKNNASIWIAIIPLITLFIFALTEIIIAGRSNALALGLISNNEPLSIHYLSTIFGQADTIFIVFEASIIASLVAIILGIFNKVFTLKQAINHFVDGCKQLLETCLILILAWTMSYFVSNIGAIYYAVNFMTSNIAWWLIPLLIFIVCCLISFAVGSYGCMFIALPMAIPIAIKVMELNPHITSNYLPLIIACGLAGSIFGDHCSPITDCTILSSKGSGCNNFRHVKTQLPYALITALVAIVVGIIPSTFGVPAIICLLLAIITFYLILRFVGQVPTLDINKKEK